MDIFSDSIDIGLTEQAPLILPAMGFATPDAAAAALLTTEEDPTGILHQMAADGLVTTMGAMFSLTDDGKAVAGELLAVDQEAWGADDALAALDVTTTELTDEIAGGTLTAGPDRLEAAGDLGLPQVVSIGATDQITFTPPSAVPTEYWDRNCYAHNPSITLVRTNADESVELGRMLAEKLNRATGPVSLFVPLRGASSYAIAGAVFHDPIADEALVSSLRTHLDATVELIEMDTDINDPVFAEAMARRLDEHYRAWSKARADFGQSTSTAPPPTG